MILADHGDADTPQVDLQHLHVVGLVETEDAEVQVAVMLELDPSHLQKPHAHVHLEEIGGGALLPLPPVALLLHQDQDPSVDADLQLPQRVHVLAPWVEIADVQADQEDHLPIMLIIMKRMIHALIIAKTVEIVTLTGLLAALTAAAAVESEAPDPSARLLVAEVLEGKIERGTAP